MGRIPGHETGRTITLREISFGSQPLEYLPGGGTISSAGIDGGNTGYTDEIRAGWALGRITASGLLVPCRRTTTTTTGTVTSVVLVNSYPFKVGDTISIGSDTGITISAIDYTTHTITIASTAVASGEAVIVADGSQTCIGFLDEFVKLRNPENTAAESKQVAKICVGGTLNKNYLLGDIAAIVADTTSANNLRGRLKIYDPTNQLWTL